LSGAQVKARRKALCASTNAPDAKLAMPQRRNSSSSVAGAKTAGLMDPVPILDLLEFKTSCRSAFYELSPMPIASAVSLRMVDSAI
ncbi:MAG: hypothetical protein Q8L76_14925, partial [Cypionkella sp.]|nr:hypothetical protein [Cypionkella sp.]